MFAVLVSLDQTILASALPRIVEELPGDAHYSWLALAYLLPSTTVLLIAGRLIDLVDGRQFLLLSCGGFLVSSALAGFSQNLEQLVAFRAFQGLCGGTLLAAGMGLIGRLCQEKERGKIIGLFSAASGLAAVLGPPLGGWIAHSWDWRWIFWLNLVPGSFTLLALLIRMKSAMPEQTARLDWLSSLYLVLWTFPLLTACTIGGRAVPWLSVTGLSLVVVTLFFLPLFFRRQVQISDPLIEPALLRNTKFVISSLSFFFLGGANFLAVFYLPLYLVQVTGTSTSVAGLVLGVEALLFTVGSVLCEGLVKRTSLRVTVFISQACLLSATGGLAYRMNPSTTPQECALWIGLEGLAFGLALPAFLTLVQNSVSSSRVGIASSCLQFSRLLGSTLFTGLLASNVSENSPDLAFSLKRLFAHGAILALTSLLCSLGLLKDGRPVEADPDSDPDPEE